jgi:hypothetical protein
MEACVNTYRPIEDTAGLSSSPGHRARLKRSRTSEIGSTDGDSDIRRKRRLSSDSIASLLARHELPTAGRGVAANRELLQPVDGLDCNEVSDISDITAKDQLVDESTLFMSGLQNLIRQGSGRRPSREIGAEGRVDTFNSSNTFLSYEFEGDITFPAACYAFSGLDASSERTRILTPLIIADDDTYSKLHQGEIGDRNLVAPMSDTERRWVVGYLDFYTSSRYMTLTTLPQLSIGI